MNKFMTVSTMEADDVTWLVYNTYFNTAAESELESKDARILLRKAIQEQLNNNPRTNIMVTGDFNAYYQKVNKDLKPFGIHPAVAESTFMNKRRKAGSDKLNDEIFTNGIIVNSGTIEHATEVFDHKAVFAEI
jgi:hypothetical protein